MPRNLSYIDKKAQPIGRPVDDLTALYKKKEDDYLIATDNYYKTKTALDSLPFLEKDRAIVDKAKDVYNAAYKEVEEAGDFENYKPDSRKLAHNLATKYGLQQVTQRQKARAASIAEMKARVDEGRLSVEKMNQTIRDNDAKDKGLQYNEETDSYVGNYNARTVADSVNGAEIAADFLKDFKANGFVVDPSTGQQIRLKDAEGNPLMRDPSTGQIISESGERVDEAELINAAQGFLQNHPQFKDDLNDRLYYELENMLYDPVTQERRDLTVAELQNLVGTKVASSIADEYNLDDIDSLPEALAAKGLTVEDLYKSIRGQQMINSAIQPGVSKEGYYKYEQKYAQDWMLKSAMEAEGSASVDMGMLHTTMSDTRFTAEDTIKVSEVYNKAETELAANEQELNRLKSINANPQDIRNQEDLIRKNQEEISITNSRLEESLSHLPKVSEAVKTLVTDKTYKLDSNFTRALPDLDINEGTMTRLLFKNLSNPISEEDLRKYIKVDKTEYLLASWKRNYGRNLHSSVTYEQGVKLITELGENAIAQLGTNGIGKERLSGAGKQAEDRQVSALHSTLQDLSDQYKTQLDSENTPYNTMFKLYNPPPNLAPKEERDNDLITLSKYTQQLTGLDPAVSTQLSSPITGVTADIAIKEAAAKIDIDLEDEDIDYSTAEYLPFMDVMKDKVTGRYTPVLQMSVEVQTSGMPKPQRIKIPVNYSEPSYVAKYRQSINSHRGKLLAKEQAEGGLSETDQLLLNNINTNLYNLSDYGRDIDNLNLYNAQDGEVIPFEYWNNAKPMNIKVYDYGSPQNMSYYLTQDARGIDGKVTRDVNGKPIQNYLATDKEGNYKYVEESALGTGEWTALGANNPNDLKTLFSNIVLDNEEPSNITPSEYRVNTDELVDISSLFGDNVNIGVDARVAPTVKDSVVNLLEDYPKLHLTDGLRKDDAGYGAVDSKHKDAKAVDFRNNDEGIALTKKSPSYLKRFGIKSASIHDEGTDNEHVHVEFL